MPIKPNAGEKKEDFIGRCIKEVMGANPEMENDQAVAICKKYWDNRSIGTHESRAVMFSDKEINDQDVMTKINRNSLEELKQEDVYIRSMYLCNNLVDSYFSRFTDDALREIVSLIPGESVMKGHDASGLPIARFFDSKLTQKPDSNGELWVRAWFYWLKNTDGAEDLARNIDGGVYKEVSICWRYDKATCNICGNQMWGMDCPHIPGETYDGELCYYEMSDIKEVLEGSLVFKGGQVGTSLAGERSKYDLVEPSVKIKKEQKGSDNQMDLEKRIKELEAEKEALEKASAESDERAKKLEEQVGESRKALNKSFVEGLRFSSAANETLKLEDQLNASTDQEEKSLRSMLKVIDGLAVEGRLVDPKSVERFKTPPADSTTETEETTTEESERSKADADFEEAQKLMGGKGGY